MNEFKLKDLQELAGNILFFIKDKHLEELDDFQPFINKRYTFSKDYLNVNKEARNYLIIKKEASNYRLNYYIKGPGLVLSVKLQPDNYIKITTQVNCELRDYEHYTKNMYDNIVQEKKAPNCSVKLLKQELEDIIS